MMKKKYLEPGIYGDKNRAFNMKRVLGIQDILKTKGFETKTFALSSTPMTNKLYNETCDGVKQCNNAKEFLNEVKALTLENKSASSSVSKTSQPEYVKRTAPSTSYSTATFALSTNPTLTPTVSSLASTTTGNSNLTVKSTTNPIVTKPPIHQNKHSRVNLVNMAQQTSAQVKPYITLHSSEIKSQATPSNTVSVQQEYIPVYNKKGTIFYSFCKNNAEDTSSRIANIKPANEKMWADPDVRIKTAITKSLQKAHEKSGFPLNKIEQLIEFAHKYNGVRNAKDSSDPLCTAEGLFDYEFKVSFGESLRLFQQAKKFSAEYQKAMLEAKILTGRFENEGFRKGIERDKIGARLTRIPLDIAKEVVPKANVAPALT